MTPRKSKALLIETAQRLNVDEKDLSLIVSHYYKKLRDTLSSLSQTAIKVDGLGTFRMKHWVIDRFYEKMKDMDISSRTENSQNRFKEDFKKIEHAKCLCDEEKERREQFKTKKEDYESKKNME